MALYLRNAIPQRQPCLPALLASGALNVANAGDRMSNLVGSFFRDRGVVAPLPRIECFCRGIRRERDPGAVLAGFILRSSTSHHALDASRA